MSSSSPPPSVRPPIRWWPAVLVVALGGALLAWVWLREAPSLQSRVVPSFTILFFSAVALFLWLVLLSRLPGGVRLGIFVGVAAAVGLGFLLLEIQGVSGNLVPIVGWRWGGERAFEEPGAAGMAGVVAPGPHDWPQFYGPGRDATLAGPALATDWEAEPPREVWRREVGEGWSSFAVVGEAAVTQELRGDLEVVVRYDLATGEQVWAHADRAPFRTTVGGSGPRATPTIVDGRVYTLGATGILNCLRLSDGERLWRREVLADHGAGQPDWGMASSPLVAGELVVVQLGRKGQSLAAYDRWSGDPAWQAGSDRGSYTTPVLATVDGRPQILVINQASVAGHHPESGELLWREPWEAPGERVTPPLLLDGDELLVSAGYGVGSRRLRIDLDAAEGERVEEVWESRRMKSKFAPMVLHRGTVFGLDDGVMVALDPESGERRWKAGRYGHGQMIRVGDVLLVQAEDGDLVLVAADPEEHRELARHPALDSKTWNPPALSGRRLLVRNDREAVCYELPVAGDP